MLLLHDAILIFQWAWSKVAAIYIFVNKLPCRVSMGKGWCCFIWKMKMLSVPELVFIVLAYSTWHSWGKKPRECGDQKPICIHSMSLAWLLVRHPKFAQARILNKSILLSIYLYYCTLKSMLTRVSWELDVVFFFLKLLSISSVFFDLTKGEYQWLKRYSLVVLIIFSEEGFSLLQGLSLIAKRI